MTPIPRHIIEQAWQFDQAIRRQKAGYRSTRYANEHSHGISKLGEFLFAQRYGLESTLNWSVHIDGDSGHDFLVNGIKIDVKTTTYFLAPELRCHPDECRADIYVLAAYKPRSGHGYLAGFISKGKLFHDRNLGDYRGMGQRYFVDRSRLCQQWRILGDVLGLSIKNLPTRQ